jgi:hypothetical protein
MSEENESGFTFRDRRRFASEPTETPSVEAVKTGETAETSEAAGTPTVEPTPQHLAPEMFFGGQETEAAAAYSETDETEFSDLAGSGFGTMGEGEGGPEAQSLPSVYAFLFQFLETMQQVAVLRLGLMPNPMTGQLERDLEEAQIAIDTAAFLTAQLEPVIPPEERLPLKAMISDLQIQFVEQRRKG